MQSISPSSELEVVDNCVDTLLRSFFDKESSIEDYFEIVSDEIRVYEFIFKPEKYEIQLDVVTPQDQFDDHDQSRSQIRNSYFHGADDCCCGCSLIDSSVFDSTVHAERHWGVVCRTKEDQSEFLGRTTERKRGELMLKRFFFSSSSGLRPKSSPCCSRSLI